VTPAIRDYVEEKISRAVHNFATGLKHIDVTISARGGDTGTHGARCAVVSFWGGAAQCWGLAAAMGPDAGATRRKRLATAAPPAGWCGELRARIGGRSMSGAAAASADIARACAHLAASQAAEG
jgi:hypothetical protein